MNNENRFFAFATNIKQRVHFLKFSSDVNQDFPYLKNWRKRNTLLTDEDFKRMLHQQNFLFEQFENGIRPLTEEDLADLWPAVKASSWFRLHEKLFDSPLPISDNVDTALRFHLSYFVKACQLEAKHDPDLVFPLDFWEELEQGVKQTLMSLAEKVLVWDVHDITERENITATSPKEIFQLYLAHRFSSILSTKQFFMEYPTLSRLLAERLAFALENFKLFLEAITESKSELSKIFHLQAPLKITNYSMSQGDSHDGGKTVILFSVNKLPLVFKYKNLHVGEQFNRFLSFIETLDSRYQFYKIKRVLGATFTIEERIPHKNCHSIEEIKLYYRRYGHLLGIVYWLGSSDLHMENLIANGSYPVLIDVETLLRIKHPKRVEGPHIKDQLISHSVLTSGLIPSKRYWKDHNDISALHGGKEKSLQKVRRVQNPQTSDIKLDIVEELGEGSSNLLLFGDEEIHFSDYTSYIEDGFDELNQTLLTHYEDVWKEITFLFSDIPLRVLVRNTQDYANFLSYSTHPSALVNYIDREKIIENLWHTRFVGIQAIPLETAEMAVHDIPFFMVNSTGRELLNRFGTVPNYFPVSPLQFVHQHIQTISPLTLRLCKTELRESLGTLQYEPLPVYIKKEQSEIESPFLKKALAIGDTLCRELWYNEEIKQIVFPTIIVSEENEPTLQYPAESLYNGLSGIFIFLKSLDQKFPKAEYKEWLKRIELELFETETEIDDKTKTISAFVGIGARLTAAFWGYLLTKENYYDKKIDSYLSLLSDQWDQHEQPAEGWIEGYSGLLALLSYMAYRTPRKKIKPLLEKIIASVHPRKMEFSGFAHGYCGVSYALQQGNYWIKDATLSAKIQKVNAYILAERPKIVNHSWCHGSVGIQRVPAFQKLYPPPQESEDSTDSETRNACLCHGLAGDLSPLIEKVQQQKLTKAVVEDYAKKLTTNVFYLKGDPSFIPLGLFDGISGVGYQLLRIEDPEFLPDVLFFTDPNFEKIVQQDG